MTEQEIEDSLPWSPLRIWDRIWNPLCGDEEDDAYYLNMPYVRINSDPLDVDLVRGHDCFEFRPGVAEFITKACNNFYPMLEALDNLENDAGTIPKALWDLVVEARKNAGGRQDA